jgi:hypothetical protein
MPKPIEMYECPHCRNLITADQMVCNDCDELIDDHNEYYYGFDAVELSNDGEFFEDIQDRERDSFVPKIGDLLRTQ